MSPSQVYGRTQNSLSEGGFEVFTNCHKHDHAIYDPTFHSEIKRLKNCKVVILLTVTYCATLARSPALHAFKTCDSKCCSSCATSHKWPVKITNISEVLHHAGHLILTLWTMSSQRSQFKLVNTGLGSKPVEAPTQNLYQIA